MYFEWRPYVSVAQRRRMAMREMEKLKKKGHTVSPVVIAGRTIATTFWGKAWCDNLEAYGDFANRLPRGRTYVRNGSVVDLQIAAGNVVASVSGSDLYKVTINVTRVAKALWNAIRKDCTGAIDSLVELLQGHFSQGVMERLCRQKTGLFPSPAEIRFSCSCPDGAYMCKHVAAALYGVGARLDRQPALLFKLRQVDENELIAGAGAGMPLKTFDGGARRRRIIEKGNLSELFGLEMAEDTIALTGNRTPRAAKSTRAKVAPVRGKKSSRQRR